MTLRHGNLLKPIATGLASSAMLSFTLLLSPLCYAASTQTTTITTTPAVSNPQPITVTPATTTTTTPAINKPNSALGTQTPVTTVSPNAVPMSQPNLKDEDVINFAIDAAKSVYSYDFKNYKKQMQQNQTYFTNTGWKAFSDALNKSHNLTAVETKKLVASGVSNGKAVIIEQGPQKGIYTWKVQVPLLATYENESKLVKQNLIVTLLVSRSNNSKGVGVSHFVAQLAPQTPPVVTTSTTNNTTTTPTTTIITPPVTGGQEPTSVNTPTQNPITSPNTSNFNNRNGSLGTSQGLNPTNGPLPTTTSPGLNPTNPVPNTTNPNPLPSNTIGNSPAGTGNPVPSSATPNY